MKSEEEVDKIPTQSEGLNGKGKWLKVGRYYRRN
jgi:hypothetical protein